MRVRFLKDTVYETEGLNKGPRFEAGSEHDMRDDLAMRWINRGLAEAAPPKRMRPARQPELAPPPAEATPAADGAPAPVAESLG